MPGWHQVDNPDIGFGEEFLDSSDETRPPESNGPLLAVIPLISESLMDSELLSKLESSPSDSFVRSRFT